MVLVYSSNGVRVVPWNIDYKTATASAAHAATNEHARIWLSSTGTVVHCHQARCVSVTSCII